MKQTIQLLAGLIVAAVFLVAGCDKEPKPVEDKDIDVEFISLEADGSAQTVTTTLTLTFDKDITDLQAADISLKRGSTGTTKGDLIRINTGVYELTVKNITKGGDIIVSVEKSGYTITGGPKTVAVYYPLPSHSKAEIEAFIEEHWQEYGYGEKPTKYIALSFDDGPSGVTQNLLNALEAKKVKATFFLIGQNIRNNKTAVKAIFDKGHELGNHSDGYSSLGSSPAETITGSLTAASAAIKEITGNDPVLFRAPNVNYGNNLTQVCTELNLAIIGVNVWSDDWRGIETQDIIANVINNSFLSDGGIINCHELANTVAAVPDMIDGLRDKGFWIMTVGELAIVKGVTLQAGTQYDSIR